MAERKKNEVTIEGRLIWMSDILERGNSEIIQVRIENQTGKYENIVQVDFFNDKIDDILLFEEEIGKAEVRVRASVNGRLWKKNEEDDEKYFESLIGWSMKYASTPETSERRRRRKHSDDSEETKSEDETSMPGEEKVEQAEEVPEEKTSKRRAKRNEQAEDAKIEEDLPF